MFGTPSEVPFRQEYAYSGGRAADRHRCWPKKNFDDEHGKGDSRAPCLDLYQCLLAPFQAIVAERRAVAHHPPEASRRSWYARRDDHLLEQIGGSVHQR